jgi:hypothetical protein
LPFEAKYASSAIPSIEILRRLPQTAALLPIAIAAARERLPYGHKRNSRCFWEGLIWREPERKIGVDTKKNTSQKLVINTVFLLVSN